MIKLEFHHLPHLRLRGFFPAKLHRDHGPLFLLPQHCGRYLPDLRDEHAAGRLDQGAESALQDSP